MSTDSKSSDAPSEDTQSADDVSHKNAKQDVIVVDSDDNEQGLANRLEAHLGDGIRHRAFTALIFDEDGRILLAQRSPTKRLWNGYWDGTVASHPREGETQEEATRKRLDDELGISPDQYDDLRVTDKFEYKRYYPNEGVEYEVCSVLKLTLTDTSLDPNDEEVGGLMWVPYHRLHEHPEWYRQLRLCPWFEIAMRRDFD